MNTNLTFSSVAVRALLVAITAFGSSSVLAAGNATTADTKAKDQRPAGSCQYGPSTDGNAGCMTKADSDETRSRQAALDRDPTQYMRNALVRCDRLTGDDRQDCVLRISGKGTTSGSVEGGGIYRELVTREVAVPQPAPAAQ